MITTSIKQVQAKLEAESHQLTERLRRVTASSGHDGALEARFPQYGSKDDENAAEVATFQDNLSLTRDLEQSLVEVEAALAKIKDGSYGRCANCGEPIDEARLVALPAAALCVKCKSSP